MADMNKVFLVGNLTRDPEMRYTPGGSAICQLGLAINRKYTTRDGQDQEEVCFVDCDVWGRQAESCGQYLRKGSPVLIEGRLKYDAWDDRETGKKRSRLTVTAERVQFLSGGGSDRSEADGSGRHPGGGERRGRGYTDADAGTPRGGGVGDPFAAADDAADDLPF